MMVQKGQFLIFLMICMDKSSCIINTLYEIGEVTLEFYSMLNKINFMCPTYGRLIEDFSDEEYGGIKDHIYKIHNKLFEIENSINSEIMMNVLTITKSAVNSFSCVDKMKIYTTSIAHDYKKFDKIIIKDGWIHNSSLYNLQNLFFPDIASNIGMIRKIMTKPDELLPGESNLIAAIVHYAKDQSNSICNTYQPIDEILMYLLKTTMIAEIKTSLMWPFASKYECEQEQVTEWKMTNINTQATFQKYLEQYMNIMKKNLELTTDLYIRACDPENATWILNKNYYDLDGILQAVIFGYKPTQCSPLYSPIEVASQFCNKIWKERRHECGAKYYNKQSGCPTTPFSCENLGVVQACVLKNGPYKFKYVNSSEFGFYGNNNTECLESYGHLIDNEEGPDSVYNTCSCHCRQNNNQISLMMIKSRKDTDRHVVVGLRFKRSKSILHIQPRVGKLMANGFIEINSERWIKIPKNIDASYIHPIDMNQNVFFLDDVYLPPKYVLTGVKFTELKRADLLGYSIEIEGVLFDYSSGDLNHEEKIQLSSLETNPGRPLMFTPISSIHMEEHDISSPTNRQYLQLQQSFLRSDFGQSTLPLFDAVPVMTEPSSILGGIGLFHKGTDDYAGFISLRAYGIKYRQYFENTTIS